MHGPQQLDGWLGGKSQSHGLDSVSANAAMDVSRRVFKQELLLETAYQPLNFDFQHPRARPQTSLRRCISTLVVSN